MSDSEQVELLKPRSVFDVQNVHASASHMRETICPHVRLGFSYNAVSTNALCHNGLSSGRPKPYKSPYYVLSASRGEQNNSECATQKSEACVIL
jgi:hypothetical protein